MNHLKRQIPNLITMLNLLMGCVGVNYASEGDFISAGICSGLGIFFDFFDGLAARLLKVNSELGKQLDSLADMVTSGLVPGFVIFQLLRGADSSKLDQLNTNPIEWYAFVGFLITLGSAYRLAKFNVDETQSHAFIGLPTPANTILVLSIPFIIKYENIIWLNEILLSKMFLISLSIFSTFLLNMRLELFSLKLKSLSFKENKIVYSFLIASVILVFVLQFLAIPIIIISYILISLFSKKKSAKAEL